MKILRTLFVSFLVAVIVASVVFVHTKPRLDRWIVRQIFESRGSDVEINFFDYGKFSFSGFGVVFQGVYADGVSRVNRSYFVPRRFKLNADEIRLSVADLLHKKIVIQIKGLQFLGGRFLDSAASASTEKDRVESVSEINCEALISLSIFPQRWKEKINKRAAQIQGWLLNDQPIQDMNVSGVVAILIKQKVFQVHFFTRADANGYVHLEGNPQDLHKIAEAIETKFTNADVEIAAKNLLRTSQLLHFRNAAEEQMKILQKRAGLMDVGKSRHIFWSYWLARTYGADFALQVTRAHEVGDTLSTPAQSAVDRKYNQLGTEYAARKLTDKQIAELFFSDPRVAELRKMTKQANDEAEREKSLLAHTLQSAQAK